MKKLTYTQLEEIINRHDPLGLIGAGAPINEYEPEINDLLRRRNNRSSSLNWNIIQTVFELWFYPGCISKETAQEIEKDIQVLF